MCPLDRFRRLASTWSEEASTLRRRGCSSHAELLESVAADLTETIEQHRLEELTLDQAAAEAGISADAVGRRISRGDLPNVGRKGRPRVRRCDLWPGLGGAASRSIEGTEPDLVETLYIDYQ